jgi:hypothetical protein
MVTSAKRVASNANHLGNKSYGDNAMSGPYFQKESWPPFAYQGQTYDFTHLDEYQVEANDSTGQARRIAISFSDHCFTREPVAGDDPALRYPESTRVIGCFCVDRYQLSLNLAHHISRAVKGKVWIVRDTAFAAVPTIDHTGNKVLYGIVFSLIRVTGFPVQLHMRVDTAYPCDEHDIITYGNVRFSQLIKLRMQHKSPKRNFDKHRPKPRRE